MSSKEIMKRMKPRARLTYTGKDWRWLRHGDQAIKVRDGAVRMKVAIRGKLVSVSYYDLTITKTDTYMNL